MPIPIDEILHEINSLLGCERFQDYGPNGLQVPGPGEVSSIATGVSAHVELFELAAAERVELLLVHHGLFWGAGFSVIDEPLKRRLSLLLDAGIALAAYHLPLDAHPEIGNNALIASALGAHELERFAPHHGEPIGIIAHFPADGVAADELFGRVGQLTAREPLVFRSGPTRIRRLAIVSGAGSDFLSDATVAGADAFLTGEPTERAMAIASESQMHYIAAGHYATETFGIRRLGEHLAERFGLRHVFLDVPNPV
jgi:dinuclear metal center YbgI/SA1388 family protein